MEIYIGCCGFPVARSKYFSNFKVVEIQQTFYKIPKLETAEKWRKEAPKDFIYTMKVWQLITHPPSSPTWRKAGIKVEPAKARNYGYFKPTEENIEAWHKTITIARILNAKILVAQTPPSFGYSAENKRNIIEFFKQVKNTMSGFLVGWEPRGSWRNYPHEVLEILEETNLIHVVDPFRWWPPIKITKTIYLRLHGIGGRETNYGYQYNEDDYRLLCNKILELEDKNVAEVYVMFNNKYMFNNALEFRHYASKKGCKVK